MMSYNQDVACIACDILICYLVNPGGRLVPPCPPKPGGRVLPPPPNPGGLLPPNPGGETCGGRAGSGGTGRGGGAGRMTGR